MSKLWIAITILGPLLLAGVMLWSLLRNRKQSAAQKDRTERATHDLYAEEDRIAHRDRAVDTTPLDPPASTPRA
jgi:flagellar basal body-associated protein FliL